MVTVLWLYHGAAASSTPPQGIQGNLLDNRGNYLQIND
jgi:hypothetical protein